MSYRPSRVFLTPLAGLLSLAAAASVHAQAAAAPAPRAVIKPGDNLVTDGLPEIPAEIADAVGRYTEFRSADLASWHPTKREMLISTRFADTQPAPRGALPARRAPPAHVLSGPRRQLELAAPLGGLRRLHQGQGRRRVRPDPPARRRERRHHPALARRPLAERPRPLVAPGRPHGLRLDPAQRIRPRRLRDGPEGRGLRADGARGEGRRLVRFRLVARRQEARGVRGDLGQRELPLARRRRHGREDARHPERRLRSRWPTAARPSAPTARGCT